MTKLAIEGTLHHVILPPATSLSSFHFQSLVHRSLAHSPYLLTTDLDFRMWPDRARLRYQRPLHPPTFLLLILHDPSGACVAPAAKKIYGLHLRASDFCLLVRIFSDVRERSVGPGVWMLLAQDSLRRCTRVIVVDGHPRLLQS